MDTFDEMASFATLEAGTCSPLIRDAYSCDLHFDPVTISRPSGSLSFILLSHSYFIISFILSMIVTFYL